MMNLYKVAKKVILINPFSTPYKNVPYTALFYHTMTLKCIKADDIGREAAMSIAFLHSSCVTVGKHFNICLFYQAGHLENLIS